MSPFSVLGQSGPGSDVNRLSEVKTSRSRKSYPMHPRQATIYKESGILGRSMVLVGTPSYSLVVCLDVLG